MADYTPIAMPGTAYTLQASGVVAGGDLVGMTGGTTVARITAAASLAYVGVAGNDAAIGQKVTVHIAKAIHESVAEGAIAPGDQLVSSSAANRQVRTLAVTAAGVNLGATYDEAAAETAINTAINTAVNNARAVIGVAVTAAADNETVRWVQR